MSGNIFFKNRGPFSIKKIIDICKGKTDSELDRSIKIHNIADLFVAKQHDITFFIMNMLR